MIYEPGIVPFEVGCEWMVDGWEFQVQRANSFSDAIGNLGTELERLKAENEKLKAELVEAVEAIAPLAAWYVVCATSFERRHKTPHPNDWTIQTDATRFYRAVKFWMKHDNTDSQQ